MIGGLFKSNRLAVLAGSAFIAGGLAVSPAQAADLGGDCCADLEERVATLEATTVRKGNRKVSLTISGLIVHQLMYWDDGFDSDVYQGTNVTDASTAINFNGSAKINHDLSAGFHIRLVLNTADNYSQDQFNDDGTFEGIYIANSSMHLKSESLGKVSWGRVHPPSDNIGFVDLSGLGSAFASNLVMFDGGLMRLRTKDGGFVPTGAAFPATVADPTVTDFARWGDLAHCNQGGSGNHNDCNGYPLDGIRYDTPTIAGFVFSAFWGEDDVYDFALRWNGNLGDFTAYVGVGYVMSEQTSASHAGPTLDTDYFQVGWSIIHNPTGLFFTGTYGHEEADVDPTVTDNASIPDTDTWFLKAGIRQKWNPLGATVIYGAYGESEDGFDAARDLFGTNVIITGSEWKEYGIGIVQEIDAAAMALFLKYKHYEAEVSGFDNGVYGSQEFEDLDVVVFGGVMTF